MSVIDKSLPIRVGAGLRHPHYDQVLSEKVDIDFVEVHAENFYIDGGINLAVLERARELYDVSLHCTALGVGSAIGTPNPIIEKLAGLVERVDPMLVSDHLCFCWANMNGRRVHAGDLLPVMRTPDSFAIVCSNIERVQESINRPLLIENVSAYIDDSQEYYSESEFLNRLVERTGCRLLVDINNLLVNAHNKQIPDPVDYARLWLEQIPVDAVSEIHLAGYTPVPEGQIAVDDHGAAVSESGWEVYRYALTRFGGVHTLIEWDNALPEWSTIQAQVQRARDIGAAVLGQEIGDE